MYKFEFNRNNFFNRRLETVQGRIVNYIEARAQPRKPSEIKEFEIYYEGLYIPPNESLDLTFEFPQIPVIDITVPILAEGTGVDIMIDSWTPYAWGMKLTLRNVGAEGNFCMRKFRTSDGALLQSLLSHSASYSYFGLDSGGNIYIGDYTSGILYKYNNAGTLIWSKDTGGRVYITHVDSSGNTYCAVSVYEGASIDKIYIKKYDSNGNLSWSTLAKQWAAYGVKFWAIVTDSNGNSYFWSTDSPLTEPITIKKYNSNGVWLWTKSVSTCMNSVAVDSDGYLYVGSWDLVEEDTYYLRKFTSNYELVWSVIVPTFAPDTIGVDSNGNVYTCGYYEDNFLNHAIRKYTSGGGGGGIINSSDVYYGCDISFDSNNNVYIGGLLNNGNSVGRFNPSGTMSWSAYHGKWIHRVLVRGNTVYAAGGSATVTGGVSQPVTGLTTTGKTLDTAAQSGGYSFDYTSGGDIIAVQLDASILLYGILGLDEPFSHDFIQNETIARYMLNAILGEFGAENRFVTIDTRGNIALKPGDIVRVSEYKDTVFSNYRMTRHVLSYNGALSGVVEGVKTE